MRKSKKQKPAPQRDAIVFDRSPAKDKLELDIDTACASADEHGLSSVDIVRALLLKADVLCSLATERGDDMSELEGLL